MTVDAKELYEDLDALHGALPETERERLAEVVGLLTTVMATEKRQLLVGAANRWRLAAGYPRFKL